MASLEDISVSFWSRFSFRALISLVVVSLILSSFSVSSPTIFWLLMSIFSFVFGLYLSRICSINMFMVGSIDGSTVEVVEMKASLWVISGCTLASVLDFLFCSIKSLLRCHLILTDRVCRA